MSRHKSKRRGKSTGTIEDEGSQRGSMEDGRKDEKHSLKSTENQKKGHVEGDEKGELMTGWRIVLQENEKGKGDGQFSFC